MWTNAAEELLFVTEMQIAWIEWAVLLVSVQIRLAAMVLPIAHIVFEILPATGNLNV